METKPGELDRNKVQLEKKPSCDFLRMSFDIYCPLATADLEKRVFNQCGLYFPSQAAKLNHARIHRHAAVNTEVTDVGVMEPESVSAILSTASSTSVTESSDDGLSVVHNLFDWLQSVFVEVE
ncbi:hypothetical protein CHS0354_036380 [Potamilus streckersoni]|uniref:Uncharacterized protein n=1 Tax=Potamilus streckersoni TaxID=2493646 RepID=A0AAE0SX15_9BIVA|nr:hypothetical protein CHS0354_036380 [Potamilus streckersoni]